MSWPVDNLYKKQWNPALHTARAAGGHPSPARTVPELCSWDTLTHVALDTAHHAQMGLGQGAGVNIGSLLGSLCPDKEDPSVPSAPFSPQSSEDLRPDLYLPDKKLRDVCGETAQNKRLTPMLGHPTVLM